METVLYVQIIIRNYEIVEALQCIIFIYTYVNIYIYNYVNSPRYEKQRTTWIEKNYPQTCSFSRGCFGDIVKVERDMK